MNKKTLKIAGWALGLSVTVAGIGVIVGAPQMTPIETTADAVSFTQYSGEITEGDYIIFYNGKAMNTTVSSDRLQYAAVTPENSVITTSNAAIVWHIAPYGDYWNLYNASEKVYAAGTGAKSKAQTLDSGTDDESLWTISGEATYEFVNKANAAASVNANLRNNGTYGFACYSTSTGGALSLFKAPSEPSLTLSREEIEVTLGTEETATVTPSSFAEGAITYSFDDDPCATLSHVGNTITIHGDAVGTHTFTITGFAGGVEQATAELLITVVDPYPTSISVTDYSSYTDTQTFTEGEGYVTVSYSDGTTSKKYLGDDGVKLLISDEEVSASAPAVSYLGSNSAKISYTEEGHTVTSDEFTLSVQTELEILSFESIPDYLIIDPNDANHSATITVNYKSLNGAPELSIVSSNPTKLPLTFDEEDNVFEGTEGAAEFTISAGTSAGQYSVTASVTYGLRTETKSFTIDVRGEAPAQSEGHYELINSISEISAGNYVIAAKNGENYYGMTRTVASSKFSGTTKALTVTDGVISSSAGAGICFTLSATDSGNNKTVTINVPDSTQYARYVSSTNVSLGASYNWTVSAANSHGTFRFDSGTSGRALIYRSTNVFGGYSTGNLNGTEYFNLELFKYIEPVPDSFDLVSAFVSDYMHMNDVSIGNNGDTGACKGDSGYYLTAKRAWNAMVSSYTGEDNLETVFSTSFEDAYARYSAWAVAMNDADPFDGEDGVVAKIHEAPHIAIGGEAVGERTLPLILAISSVGFVTLGGAFIISRRRKEDR